MWTTLIHLQFEQYRTPLEAAPVHRGRLLLANVWMWILGANREGNVQINSANSRILARVTDNDARQRQEARACTTNYDFIKHFRVMRLKWLQQILCGDPSRMVVKTVDNKSYVGTRVGWVSRLWRCNQILNMEGSILLDTSKHANMRAGTV